MLDGHLTVYVGDAHLELTTGGFAFGPKGVPHTFFGAGPNPTRALVDLIEAGLQSKEAEKERFFSLVSRLTESSEPSERERLKEELARMTFGS